MPKHRLRTPKKLPRPKGADLFQRTRKTLRKILRAGFADSQLAMADATGLSPSLLYRLFVGQRDPTPENIGVILKGLSPANKGLGLALTIDFLTDIAEATTSEFTVTVEAKK